MPMREFKTFEYIMYREELLKAKRKEAEEAAKRADEKRQVEEERKMMAEARKLPQSQREKFMAALQQQKAQREAAKNFPLPEGLDISDIEDELEDEM